MKMNDKVVIKNVITPNDQFLRAVFSAQRSYYIDIYQREYKWTDDNVNMLLNDIEVRFEQHLRQKTNAKEIQEDVLQHFEPYFLNTYLTHTTTANTSIVDGQQRLTTLLLILIKLYRILVEVEKDSYYTTKTFSSKILEQLIFETNDFGEASRFKIFNENREDTFRALAEGKTVSPKDETQQRIQRNYRIISSYYDKFLGHTSELKKYDLTKLTYYITYLLDRISIVEIKIEKQDNVAMIFEVVNDRGLGLRPYEILKGKLLGNLSPDQKEHANQIWTDLQNKYFKSVVKNSKDPKLDLDMFFQTYFRAKFANTETEYERYEGDYHYEMYRNETIREFFGQFKDRDMLFQRITQDIQYFGDLYLYLRTTYDNDYLIYNKLLDQNQQYLLIMSGLTLNDSQKTEKINGIACKFDQLHTVLRLLGAYESNSFQNLIYPLNKDIREKSLAEINTIIDKKIIEALEWSDIVPAGTLHNVEKLFEYDKFRGVLNQWPNFSKYILMRIDRWLAQMLDKPSYASASLEELEGRFNKNNLKRYGMHLEHIYAWNEANMALFTTPENGFDAQKFNQTRNLLGMVLLLKDKQNISSGNELYKDKIKTYSLSNFIWNELLSGHLSSIDKKNIPSGFSAEKVEPDATGAFPIEKVDHRQRAIFSAIKAIWGYV